MELVVLSHHAVDIDNASLKPRTIKNRFSVDYYILVVPDNFVGDILALSKLLFCQLMDQAMFFKLSCLL